MVQKLSPIGNYHDVIYVPTIALVAYEPRYHPPPIPMRDVAAAAARWQHWCGHYRGSRWCCRLAVARGGGVADGAMTTKRGRRGERLIAANCCANIIVLLYYIHSSHSFTYLAWPTRARSSHKDETAFFYIFLLYVGVVV